MRPEEFSAYVAMVGAATVEWAGRQEVLLGLESDFVPGMEDWVRELHGKADFHHVLGSVHPQVREYRARFFNGDAVDYQRVYFRHLAEAAETGLFDTVSHPDLIKNEAAPWKLEMVIDDVRAALDRIAATGCAMELNTSGLMKRIPEMNPGPIILREMAEREIPVVIGADAHVPERTGDRFDEALGMLSEAGFPCVSGFRERRRFDVPIEVARASLRL
jgi:histidinol-phosphatase (PHP family)